MLTINKKSKINYYKKSEYPIKKTFLTRWVLSIIFASGLILTLLLLVNPLSYRLISASEQNNAEASNPAVTEYEIKEPNDPALLKIDPTGKFIEGDLLVKFKEGITWESEREILDKHSLKIRGRDGRTRLLRVGPAHREEIKKALAKNSLIERVELNHVYTLQGTTTPNDPLYSEQWHLPKINAAAGWNFTTGSSSVTIAILDSGVNYDHEDLKNRVIKGYNFAHENDDPWDDTGHGTQVAGVAAAMTNNGTGIAGVDWQAKILAIKVLATAIPADDFKLYQAIDYAVDHGADVINMSLGLGDEESSWVRDSIANAIDQGVVVVSAVRNAGNDKPDCFMYYPAAYDGVIPVAGTNEADERVLSCSSNFNPADGKHHGEFWMVAPGINIFTTCVGYSDCYSDYGVSGTSFATPQVSAAAALILALNPTLTNTDIKNIFKTSSRDLGTPGWDKYYGWGRLDLQRALQSAISPQIFIAATPNPLSAPGDSVTIQIVAVDSDSDLALLQYYIEGLDRWSSLIPGISPDCDSVSCSKSLTLNIFNKLNWKYRITAVAYDEAGHIRVFCAYNCPDNEPVIGDNNIYYLKVGDGGSSSPPVQAVGSIPPKLDELSSSPGSVIINLNWADTHNESAFYLQKSIGGDTFFDFKELSADATSYSDTLPSSQEGKNLTYRVRARFSDNSYSLSNEQSIDAPTSYIPPDEWPGTVELTTSCDDNDIQAHLTFAPIQESAWYHIYDSYQGSSEQYVVKLRAQDFPPDENIYYDWKARNKWGGDLEVLNANEYSVRVVAESSSGDISSGLVWASATDCSPDPPPIDPPGTGDLAVTISCDTSSYAWAHADWNRRGGYTGPYLFQYKLSSQSTWTNSATGGKYGTWDDVGLLTFTNGNHNFRVITTHDNQVWAGPITVNVYCEPYVPVLEVSYRCSEDGGPVADLSWSIPPDPYHELSYYQIEYQRPGENWRWGLNPGPEDAAGISTEDWWYGEPLVSGEIWGWKVGAHYWGYPTTDWAGPIYALIPYFPANCSQALAGPQSPSTIVNDTSGPGGASRSWSNPQLAGYSDDSYATAVVNAESGSTTYYLKATGFGLSIPQEAVIDGIRVVVERRRSGETATDASVKLVKGGSVVGQEKGDWYTNWWAFDTNQSYGGSNDLWNTTWTPSDINNPNFGVAFAGNAGLPPEGSESLYVDNIRVMVYYTSPVSVSFPLSCDSFGDVDDDGFVSQSDVDLIAAYIAGGSLSEEQKRRADVNGDGNISQADLDIVKNYLITGISTFPVCEDPDNDGLPNYQDTDDDGDIAPTVSLTVNPATATAGEPFIITVTGTSPVGLAVVWWFGQNTGITDATVTITYPPEPTSPSKPCADVVNPTKLDRAFCSPLFDAQQAVTSYSFTSNVIINQPGTYRFGANARDVLYPTPGEPHQASEGAGIQVVEVQNQPPTLAAIGSQAVPEAQLLNITVSATDPENDPLTYNATDLPQGASFSGQVFSWTPSYQQAGIYEVVFTVSDGSLIDSKTTTITVLNDEDQDGFADTVELYIGTDPQDACPDRKENYNPAYPGDDAWPPDFNNSGKVTGGDLVPFRQHYEPSGGIYDKRFDLNADGRITTDDLAIFNKYLLKRCPF